MGKFLNSLKNRGIPFRITFLIIGISSTLWFLIRVIPKPSRASYPCMRAAAPVMSGFIIYLLAISGAFMAFKKSKKLFIKAKYIYAIVFLILAIVAGAVSLTLNNKEVSAKTFKAALLPEGPNNPMGEPQGIKPGCVVWAWDKDATNENCTNSYGSSGTIADNDGYYMNKNNDQDVINRMAKDIVLQLTGKSNLPEAWDALFKNLNQKKGNGEVGYSSVETIFIKINQGTAGWASDPSYYTRIEADWAYGKAESTAQLPLAVLKQLIEDARVPQDKIYIGDPIAHIWEDIYEVLNAVYPDVNYVDKSTSGLGRTRIYPETSASMIFSDNGHIVEHTADSLYDAMANADYLINLACLKAHEGAGITMCAKNHFGSHTNSNAAHMHPGLVHVQEWGDVMRDNYNMYRVLVDWMGHEKAGGNTILFVVDGLWGGPEATMKPVKWQMYPFNNDWPNSILASLDQVALESVCYDFLRTEFTLENHPDPVEGKIITFPQYSAIDDYLHQAADVSNWPVTIYDEFGSPAAFAGYDPEDDGSFLSSLGVHEHWNDSINMQYSSNLGTGNGIELFKIRDKEEVAVEIYAHDVPAPVFDGVADDTVWSNVDWIYIDQVWIPYSDAVNSNDFSGAFKVLWSDDTNLLYILAETIDDDFIDTTAGAEVDYYEYDILEVFIDEDNSGGDHIFDVTASGENAENAFSYHISIVIPDDGQVVTEKAIYDIDGTGWGSETHPDYEDHFPDFAVKRNGNKLTWEFSLKVYDDTYEQLDPNHEDARVALDSGKVLGLAVAYCDADDEVGRDNFFGSDWGPDNEGEFNEHWKNADGYGTLYLISESYSPNNTPLLIHSIDDVELQNLDSNVIVTDDINSVFFDPDGDSLSYTCNADDENVIVWLDEDTLKIKAEADFDGAAIVTIEADDGKGGDISTDFNVTYNFPNQNPILVGNINDIELDNLNKDITVTEDIDSVFFDPDGDSLSYTCNADDEDVVVWLDGDTLKIRGEADFDGSAIATIEADDGRGGDISTNFNVTYDPTLIIEEMINQIEVYPNPVNDGYLNISIESNPREKIEVTIYSINGKLLKTFRFISSGKTFSEILDISDLFQDLCFVEINIDGNIITKTIIK